MSVEIIRPSGGSAPSWVEILDVDFSVVSDHNIKTSGNLALTPALGGNVTLTGGNLSNAAQAQVLSGELLFQGNVGDFWDTVVTAPRVAFDLAAVDSPPALADRVQVAFYGTHPTMTLSSSNPSVNVFRRFGGTEYLNHRCVYPTSGVDRSVYRLPTVSSAMASGLVGAPVWPVAYHFPSAHYVVGEGTVPGDDPDTVHTQPNSAWEMGIAIRKGTNSAANVLATITRIRVWKMVP